MLCQRCHTLPLGPEGRCPRCDGTAWSAAAPPYGGAPGAGQPYATGPAAPGGYGTGGYGTAGAHGPGPYGSVYPAPAAPPVPGGPPHTGQVRVPSGLATVLCVLFVAGAVVDILTLVGAGMEFALFGRLEADPTTVDVSEADTVDAFYAVTAVGDFLLVLATGAAFLAWFHRVRVNAELIGPAWPQRHSRGLAVGAWFLPLLNLWLPKRITDDVWRASDPAEPAPGAARRGGPGLVLGWWLVWLGALLLSAAGSVLDRMTEVGDFAGMRAVYGTAMAAAAAGVVAGVLALLVVRRITTMQGIRQAMAASGTTAHQGYPAHPAFPGPPGPGRN